MVKLSNFLVDYAELAVIDLPKTDNAKGRAELATQVCDAVTTQGFFLRYQSWLHQISGDAF